MRCLEPSSSGHFTAVSVMKLSCCEEVWKLWDPPKAGFQCLLSQPLPKSLKDFAWFLFHGLRWPFLVLDCRMAHDKVFPASHVNISSAW